MGAELRRVLKGDGLALLGAATWAAYTVTIAPQMTRYSTLRISAWIIPFAAVLLLAAGIVLSRGGRAPAVRLRRRMPTEAPPVSES